MDDNVDNRVGCSSDDLRDGTIVDGLGDQKEELTQEWLREQANVSKQVVVLPDDDNDPLVSFSVVKETDRFKLVSTRTTNPSSSSSSPQNVHFFGGVDISFPQEDDELRTAVAVYSIIDGRTMETVYEDHEFFDLTVPYIPSFLAFREIEPLQRLVEAQRNERPECTPCVILVDGNGILHPRGAGIACFLGVRTGIPTIGVGKALFCQQGLSKELVVSGIKKSIEQVESSFTPLMLSTSSSLQTCQGHGGSEDGSKDGSEQETRVLFDTTAICGRFDEDKGADESSFDESSSRAGQQGAKPTKTVLDKNLVERLGSVCRGLAIPLRAADTRQTLACALVGHGGKIPTWRGGSSGSGSKVPIFVSVGSRVSLRGACVICAALSLARIPEPVRRADLKGREFLRERFMNQQCKDSS